MKEALLAPGHVFPDPEWLGQSQSSPLNHSAFKCHCLIHLAGAQVIESSE